MPGVDVYDEDRDARTYKHGTLPAVMHPPCRAWGGLRKLAKPVPGERRLAIWAVIKLRRVGGVLEHPARSSLWQHMGLPRPGTGQDKYGGWTLAICQHWWGHRAEKCTWLYVVGCAPAALPAIPLVLGRGTHVITQSSSYHGKRFKRGMPGWRPEVTKAEREHTPPALAAWLVALAAKCKK